MPEHHLGRAVADQDQLTPASSASSAAERRMRSTSRSPPRRFISISSRGSFPGAGVAGAGLRGRVLSWMLSIRRVSRSGPRLQARRESATATGSGSILAARRRARAFESRVASARGIASACSRSGKRRVTRREREAVVVADGRHGADLVSIEVAHDLLHDGELLGVLAPEVRGMRLHELEASGTVATREMAGPVVARGPPPLLQGRPRLQSPADELVGCRARAGRRPLRRRQLVARRRGG